MSSYTELNHIKDYTFMFAKCPFFNEFFYVLIHLLVDLVCAERPTDKSL